MKIKLIYLLIGAILAVGIFSTKINTIDKETLDLIEKARQIDVESEFWPGYNLSDYTIDVNYGKVEFKYENGKITKQKPSLGILALTISPEEDGPVIKVVPKSMLRNIVDIMGDKSKKEREDTYISFLFHEGFHGFQIDSGMKYNVDEGETNEDYQKFANISDKLDNDEEYQKMWIEEVKSLIDYLENDNKDLWIESYNRRMKYLKEVLENDFEFYMEMESQKELIEGTAKYVEIKALETINVKQSKSKFDALYYSGDVTLYDTGRLKSLILEKGKDWKEGLFSSNKTLTDLLILR